MGYWIWIFLYLFQFLRPSVAGFQSVGRIHPRFQGSQMNWIDKNGLFLLSESSGFGFGFQATEDDATKFLLNVVHIATAKAIWSANREIPVSNSDQFIFSDDGDLSLLKGSVTAWTSGTAARGVSSLELQNSGNLVAIGNDSRIIWQSFDHPTNTLISAQRFARGMKLVSDRSASNLTYTLEIRGGDMLLSAGFSVPQPYWSMQQDNRKTINEDGGQATVAIMSANSWKFYDSDNVLLWQFVFSDITDSNYTWIAVLGGDGYVTFFNLRGEGQTSASSKIPNDFCSRPEPCGRYYTCSDGNRCACPSSLSSLQCKPSIAANLCDNSKEATDLFDLGDDLGYFALPYVSPDSRTDLGGCKASCQSNCSCVAMFFQNSSGSCYLFNDVGGFQRFGNSGFDAYIKVPKISGEDGRFKKNRSFTFAVIVIIVATVLVICCLLVAAFWFYKKKNKESPNFYESSEEDSFLDALSGMPVRFTYQELETATKNFSVKLGQGGFGSVYQGNLPDGTRLAVKKLEGIGQGRKEFRAEVTSIGSIHHHHLVRLKGFCAEGTHRLLAYEFMASGSLDKWIFRKNNEFLLDWDTRYNIALGTAKGLAYLHEDCDLKIIHCDIKPENVLLDDNFVAKVSDFGLAKLMTREQSHVFTTLRGTRGYLAPEWITNYAISEKSDVYSYGMLLLETIGGRKNFDPSVSSEKSHFPSYAFKMMEEGNFKELVDAKLEFDGEDERVANAVKVALWCIQEDMHLRPAMSKVVQMLEGLCLVPQPPLSSPLGARVYSSFFKSVSSEGTSSGPSGADFNSDAYLSAVQLSGPR